METSKIERVLASALREGALSGVNDDGPALCVFYDLDDLRAGFREVQRVFPQGALHTTAVKANGLPAILKEAKRFGLGAESASLGELVHALELGFEPSNILFDSPAKTRSEIELALSRGVILNVDNFQEVERIAQALGKVKSNAIVGMRVNPQVGAGTIASTSTATSTSKFGITLDEHRDAIFDAFAKYPWLRGLHVHVGSQGCGLDLLVRGARRAVDLALALRGRGHTIDILDIGGGLSVDYAGGDAPPAFAEYASMLREHVPEIFDGTFRIATEFGRALHAKTGWVASRVEYTKSAGGRRIAVTHAGAELFVRAVYQPDKWAHRITIHDATGALKSGPAAPWDIAGPLCFSGDLIAVGRELPAIEPGDFVVVHDAGAYTLSMWSRYNSRLVPAVYGYEGSALHLMKAAETTEDLIRFWS
ncbi:diaminopimelate decarboxylase [Pendulispora brunnea]|uniref:Diaminopimelate decarboxylase n=1 Tax=Pendulispora brunnea TaxID=2905690 RepID=A0ABZ2KFW5_9BACT